jgi:hypothetical protein
VVRSESEEDGKGFDTASEKNQRAGNYVSDDGAWWIHSGTSCEVGRSLATAAGMEKTSLAAWDTVPRQGEGGGLTNGYW